MKNEVYYSENFTCGHCYNLSKMELIGSVNNVTNRYDDPHGPGVEFYDVYEVLKCPKCTKVNIRVYGWSDYADPNDDMPDILPIYPNHREEPLGMPKAIENAYRSAELIKNTDTNAYAILLRRLLEMVCIDREAIGRDLAKMLQDLAKKSEIPQNLVEVANGLKNLGNIGAHAGSGDLGIEEVPVLKALADAILEYVYSAPQLVSIVKSRLLEIKKSKKQ